MRKILTLALIGAFALGAVSCSGGDDGGDSKPQYTVTFNADGGTPAPASQKVKEGETVTAPPTVTKTGYAFLFWSQNGTAAYNFSTPVTSNITLTAHWQSEATVEYWQVAWELNGGAWPAGDNHATQVVRGGTLAEPAAPIRGGYTFEGWYKEAALTNRVSFPYDVSAITGNFTLYAKWTTGGGNIDPEGTFSSIAALKTWLASQPANTAETPYQIALKGVNLDTGNNWNDLGLAVKGDNFVELDLSGCTGTAIPDGRKDSEWIGGRLTVTYYGVFTACGNLTAITLPGGVKTVGMYAFMECTQLGSVILPDGLTEIHELAFRGCDALTSIALPDGLKVIGGYAFNPSGLTSITIPGSVKNLETWTFNGSDLQTIVLEEGVETIGEAVFASLWRLESVTLPSTLKTIGNSAFSHASSNREYQFKTITIPASVTSIGSNAFSESDDLEEIVMLPTAPPSLGYNAFGTIHNDRPEIPKIKVPAASVNAYKSSWSYYASQIVAM